MLDASRPQTLISYPRAMPRTFQEQGLRVGKFALLPSHCFLCALHTTPTIAPPAMHLSISQADAVLFKKLHAPSLKATMKSWASRKASCDGDDELEE